MIFFFFFFFALFEYESPTDMFAWMMIEIYQNKHKRSLALNVLL